MHTIQTVELDSILRRLVGFDAGTARVTHYDVAHLFNRFKPATPFAAERSEWVIDPKVLPTTPPPAGWQRLIVYVLKYHQAWPVLIEVQRSEVVGNQAGFRDHLSQLAADHGFELREARFALRAKSVNYLARLARSGEIF